MKNKLYYGVAYYPELWDEATIQQDIIQMKKLGIDTMRMGEFAWAKMEPEQGKIDIGFFVDIIERLYCQGIDTIMCTPTAAPPVWLAHNHPERMVKDERGVMEHGARQHACTNNAFFRERSRIIVEAVAKAVGRHPGVIAWQIDNEFKCHVKECLCESCRELWRQWLQKRYGSIERLNEAWGTHIWSQWYQSFEQVPQPGVTPFIHNASLLTMYRIFTREMIAQYQNEQLAIIRRYSDAPVTHNSNVWFAVDNELMFKNLDFASFDDYPSSDNYYIMLMQYDLFRNFKKSRNFWVMETSTSHNGYLEAYHKTHPKGFVSAEAVSAYALGAGGFSHWLWRQQRSGCELPHGAVLSCWGKPTIGYGAVEMTSAIKKRIEKHILSTQMCTPEVAITYSDRARVFFLTEPLEKIDYFTVMSGWYKMLMELGIHRDILPEGASLEGYKILLSPFLPYISEEYLEKGREFVQNGGVWIVGPMSGFRTEDHTVHTDAALGRIEQFAGVETIYFYPIGATGAVGDAFGVSAELSLWSAVFKLLEGAEGKATVKGIIRGGAADGLAFITEKVFGKGKIVMLGAMPSGESGLKMLQAMVLHYILETGATSLKFDVTPGTIVAPRENEKNTYWIAVNMDGKGGSISIPGGCKDALTGEELAEGKLKLDAYEYRVIIIDKL